MFDCTTSEYDEIYAPWLANPGELLKLAGYRSGDKLMDLCGGTGAVTKAALEGDWPKSEKPRMLDITLLDLNPRMLSSMRVMTVRGRAEKVLPRFYSDRFDVVVCRQAMGYLDPAPVISGVSRVLRPGGVFVFNTFEKPKRFGWKSKTHGGSRYVEAHFFAFGRVFHVQSKLDGRFKADLSIFRYHPKQALCGILAKHFDVEVSQHGRGLHWRCVKRKDRFG